jgi:hypothetical protein
MKAWTTSIRVAHQRRLTNTSHTPQVDDYGARDNLRTDIPCFNGSHHLVNDGVQTEKLALQRARNRRQRVALRIDGFFVEDHSLVFPC